MPPQSTSIQSYFSRSSSPVKSSSPTRSSSPIKSASPYKAGAEASGDPELNSIVEKPWVPDVDYRDVDISNLIPGPQCITFMGRIVNFYDQSTPSKMPQAAKGCIKMIVRDDAGALTVRLWYADHDYKLRLGHLVSVWAPHISDGMAMNLSVTTAPLLVNIFPERDRSCHFMVHEQSDEGKQFKQPLGYEEGDLLPGLVTLKDYINGQHEKDGVRILVCVKSIGPKKTLKRKKGDGTTDVVNIGIFDDTTNDASLTLWGTALSSVDPWQPSLTMLLITNPSFRQDRYPAISLAATTYVDIDPNFEDADWVRKYAQTSTKREHTNPAFPEGVFDLEATLQAPVRILYTLADIDEQVRDRPYDTFTGFLSVIILDMNIFTHFIRGTLLCTECCGVPLYSNQVRTACKQCSRQNVLRPNPKLVGQLLDETGVVASGKLIWSDRAWEQLLGRTKEELSASSSELLRYLERRMMGLRITLVVGWAGGDGEAMGGRLGVLSVMM